MAELTDDEKLRIALKVLTEILCSIKSWDTLKTWLNNVTSSSLKTSIANRFDERMANEQTVKTELTT